MYGISPTGGSSERVRLPSALAFVPLLGLEASAPSAALGLGFGLGLGLGLGFGLGLGLGFGLGLGLGLGLALGLGFGVAPLALRHVEALSLQRRELALRTVVLGQRLLETLDPWRAP